MTQRAKVLAMLRAAGPAGLHSFQFLEAGIPRVAARIHELRTQKGYEIESEHEAFHGEAEGVRYKLVGTDTDNQPGFRALPVGSDERAASVSVRSSESVASEAVGSRALGDTPSVKAPGVTPRSVPSMFDPDVDWSAA